MDVSINGTFDKLDKLAADKLAANMLTAAKADAWRQRIETQRNSGQSIRAWCRANNLHEHCFYFWRVRLGLSPAKHRRLSRPPNFARVMVNLPATEAMHAAAMAKPAATESIRLRLAGERELILPVSMPLEQVAKLVHALEGKLSSMEGKP
jgi:hypothetical protein